MREASAGSPARLRSRQATVGAILAGPIGSSGGAAATTGWAGAISSCRGAGRAIGARDGAGAAPGAVAGPRRRFRPPRLPRRRGFPRTGPVVSAVAGVAVVAAASSEPCISSACPFISSELLGWSSVASPASSASLARSRDSDARAARAWKAERACDVGRAWGVGRGGSDAGSSADSATSASGTPSTLLPSDDSTDTPPERRRASAASALVFHCDLRNRSAAAVYQRAASACSPAFSCHCANSNATMASRVRS